MSLTPSVSVAARSTAYADHMDIAEAIETELATTRMQASIASLSVNRRDFLKLGTLACGGFALGVYAQADANGVAANASTGQLNHFIHIGNDGRITIFAANPELGQGVKTSIPMIAAEELGAKWSDVKVLQSPVDESKYGRHYAGGSTTTPRCFDQMRQVGAAARAMLIAAAAQKMNATASEFTTRDSMVIHTSSNRQFKFAELAAAAARQPAPDAKSLKFKDRKDYTLLGTHVTGVDNRALVTGQPLFGSDVTVPGMLYATYQKCPAVFGKVKSANLDVIKKMPGIVDAFVIAGNNKVDQLLSGVAIVGKSTWSVFSAKRQLKVEWDESTASKDSWTDLTKRAKALDGTQGSAVTNVGTVDAAFADANNKTVSAFYTYPFAYHACMEPMTCTAHYQESNGKKHLEVWAPTQAPERIFSAAQELFGLQKDDVRIHLVRVGGAFGRRGSTEFSCEAIAISQHVKAPVKLTWTREDDLEHDYFRVGGFQSLKGAVDSQGKLAAWDQHVIGMSVAGQPVRGFNFAPTEFPLLNLKNARGTRTMFDIKTPCGPWRAPGANTMAWAVQSFIHELAHAAGRDHVEFMLEIMGEPRWFKPGDIRSLNTGRAAAVIKLAAEKAGWGKPMPKGRALGLAFHFCHAAPVAEIVDLSVDANKKITIHNITVATDVGPIVNMSGAINQVQGSVIDGLSTMLGLEITMENGRMQQANFHNYRMLRINQTPNVDVHFIQSDNAPTGLGEPALPPLAPAIGNAIFAATGHRVRTMPISKEGFTV